MRRKEIVKFITRMVEDGGLTFSDYAVKLEEIVKGLSLEDIKMSLIECGVIPESFSHDSTEEKLYSKYSDMLLARTLTFMGIDSKVIKERADAADVEGRTKDYTLVADGKVFRLSRTAKNQKDFKVEALDKWRGAKDFACLVSPLYQYPKNKSQIYRQAIGRNVTLLSYIHLYFILSQNKPNKFNYKPLWLVGKKLKGAKGAITYWKAIDKTLCSILNKNLKEIEKVKKLELDLLKGSAKEEMAYIDGKIETIKALPHNEAIDRLIKSEKLDRKINQIKRLS